MFYPSRPQLIFEKELRFLKSPVEGLLSYSNIESDTVRLVDCETPEFLRQYIKPNLIVRRFPRLPNNNVMTIVYCLLEVALERENKNGRKILNKLKIFAYDQQINIFDLLEISERAKYNEIVLKKLFVEFFHLGICTTEKNKVQKLMHKYPIMQASFLLLFRKLMSIQNIPDSRNLQMPLPTAWVLQSAEQMFGLRYQNLQKVIAQDKNFVYKICQNQRCGDLFDDIREVKVQSVFTQPSLKTKRHMRSYTANFSEFTKYDQQKTEHTSIDKNNPTKSPPPILYTNKNTNPSSKYFTLRAQQTTPKKQIKKPIIGHYRRHSDSNSNQINAIQKPLLFRKQSSQFIRKTTDSLQKPIFSKHKKTSSFTHSKFY